MSKELVIEALTPVAITLVGGLWAIFKAKVLKKAKKEEAYNKVLDCIESAVQQTYEGYVRDIKASRADGKLTSEERDVAKDAAVRVAKEQARHLGLEAERIVGEDLLPMLVERMVAKLKARKK